MKDFFNLMQIIVYFLKQINYYYRMINQILKYSFHFLILLLDFAIPFNLIIPIHHLLERNLNLYTYE